MTVTDNGGSSPNYYPNTVQGTPRPQLSSAQFKYTVKTAAAARYPHSHPNDDFAQAAALFSRVMTEQDRKNLISNIVGHAKAAKPEIQKRVVEYFSRAHPEYGRRVAEGLRSASL